MLSMRLPCVLVALWLPCFGVDAWADSKPCPAIRPGGLDGSQVEDVVLRRVGEALHQDPARLDRSRSIEALVGPPRGQTTEIAVLVAIGEALGFDGLDVYGATVKAPDGTLRWERLDIRTMLKVARETYGAGVDSPEPAAAVGASYQLAMLEVGTPVPAAGWTVASCGELKAVFRRTSAFERTFSVAEATVMSLPPFADEPGFVRFVRANVATFTIQGVTFASLDVQAAAPVEGAPCATLTAIGTAIGTAGGAPYRMRARLCHDPWVATRGYAALYAVSGEVAPTSFVHNAEAFISTVVPRADRAARTAALPVPSTGASAGRP